MGVHQASPQSASSPGQWLRLSKRMEMIALTGLNRRRRFTWQGEAYKYCVHSYNSAWHSERTIEIPIALAYVRRCRSRAVLEVGNVLGHYAPVQHRVLDKYEHYPGVLNLDVVDYDTDDRFDLIISVSTLEHVGWDEDVVDADKPLRAVDHLVTLLAPGGTLLVTLPLGYNPHVDAALNAGAFRFDEVSYLKRVSRDNRWRETPRGAVGPGQYGHPFPAANVVAIGVAIRPDPSASKG